MKQFIILLSLTLSVNAFAICDKEKEDLENDRRALDQAGGVGSHMGFFRQQYQKQLKVVQDCEKRAAEAEARELHGEQERERVRVKREELRPDYESLAIKMRKHYKNELKLLVKEYDGDTSNRDFQSRKKKLTTIMNQKMDKLEEYYDAMSKGSF